jgi:hypothetical protein
MKFKIQIKFVWQLVFHPACDECLAKQNLPNIKRYVQCSLRYLSVNTPAIAAAIRPTEMPTSVKPKAVPLSFVRVNRFAALVMVRTRVKPWMNPWVKHNTSTTITLGRNRCHDAKKKNIKWLAFNKGRIQILRTLKNSVHLWHKHGAMRGPIPPTIIPVSLSNL